MLSKKRKEAILDYIKTHQKTKSMVTISKETGVPRTTLRRYAKSIGIVFEHNATLKKNSTELDNDIIANYYKDAAATIAKRHGVSESKVNSRAAELKLPQKKYVGRDGKKAEMIEYVENNFYSKTNSTIWEALNISKSKLRRLRIAAGLGTKME